MQMNKLGINIFTGFDFQEVCEIGYEVGFNAVFSEPEDSINAEKIKQNRMIANRYNMYYETSHSIIPGCTGLWCDKALADEYAGLLKICIDNCFENDIPILVVHVQTNTDRIETEYGLRVLDNIIKYAKVKNVKIAFENINNAPLLYEVMNTFKDDNVGFCFDCGHELCHTPGEDFLSNFGDRLICTHLHDNDGTWDSHNLPYTDKVDFDRIASQLRELKYQGALTLELAYKGDMSKKDFMVNAIDRLKNLYEKIGG